MFILRLDILLIACFSMLFQLSVHSHGLIEKKSQCLGIFL
ncbi:chitin-binding protein [Legionella sainthelensi]|nr:chitin-binding protein [Legionella sainthelensi]